jgi:spoIIIJ-associated protein
MEPIENEGKTVTDAVEAALKRLGLRRDQVEVEILQEGANGFMGIGSKPARVRLTEKHWGDAAPAPAAPVKTQKSASRSSATPAPRPAARKAAPAAAAVAVAPAPKAASKPASKPAPKATAPAAEKEKIEKVYADPKKAVAEATAVLNEMLTLMNLSATHVTASWDEKQERVLVVVEGDDADAFAAQEGKPLESLQMIVHMILNRRLGAAPAVQIDAGGHWKKKEAAIIAEAQRGIEEVQRTGKSFRLTPMEPSMRRLVHRHLAGNSDIETASEGEGLWRKIVLRPKNKS